MNENACVYQYRNPDIEKMPRKDLENLQLSNLRTAVGWALRTPFYRERLPTVGINSPDDIKSLEDFRRIPYTTKDDLAKGYPFGFLGVALDDVVRLHSSSGTTGNPKTIYYTAGDLKRWSELLARGIWAIGCTKKDVFQNMISYGLFTGGLGLHAGGEEVGMLVIPSGSGNITRQLKLMQDFGTTVVHATPNFLLHFESKMKEEGVAMESLKLKKAITGVEPHSEDTRRRIERLLNIDVYNSYGLTEMNGPGVGYECQAKDGMHLWEDCYIGEIIDPETLKPLPDGETGELVVTCLCREASPILRYRTRDLTSFYTDPCVCGRTHRRLSRLTGRTDDMLIINGVNVFPSQIEEVVMRMSEVGNNYLIVVEKEGALDRLIVKVEVGPDIFTDDSRTLNALKEKILRTIQAVISIKPKIELQESGSLPVAEGKAVRVHDKRPKDI